MKAAYLFSRILRWALWLVTVGYFIEFVVHRQDHLNSFGHLLLSTEAWMFSLPIAAVFAGFLELAMRERMASPDPELRRH